MSDKVLVAVPGLGVLALEPGVYRQALAEGAALGGTQDAKTAAADEPLLDAEQLAACPIPAGDLDRASRERAPHPEYSSRPLASVQPRRCRARAGQRERW